MDRREFFGLTAKVAALAAMGTVATKTTGCALTETKYDVHNHLLPDFYVNDLAGMGITTSGGLDIPQGWSPASAIALMDSNNVSGAVIHLSSPGTFFGDNAAAAQLARQVNEYGATMVNDYPGRFAYCATLPMPAVDESLAEAVYALDVLNADGICLLACSGDKFLGDPIFEDLMAELNSRRTTVYVHPHYHSSSESLGLAYPQLLIEFPMDTTRAAANLVATGTMERYPNIRWILAHAGGAVPYLAWRIALLDYDPTGEFLQRAPKGGLHYLKQFYFDTALSTSVYALPSVLELVPASQLIFGTDTPFAPDQLLLKQALDLSLVGLSPSVLNQILNNAATYFPRLLSAP